MPGLDKEERWALLTFILGLHGFGHSFLVGWDLAAEDDGDRRGHFDRDLIDT